MEPSFSRIQSQQLDWARGHGILLGRAGYVANLEDNLVLGRLNDDTRVEFSKGDGSELLPSGSRPPKMCALVSSSALAVNFFDSWRHTTKSALQQALGLPKPIADLRFEHKCKKYPVPPRTPNLDLLLTLDNGQVVGIESKFAEPYRNPGIDSPLSLKYHPRGDGFWADRGLPRVQELADRLRGEWDYLDVPQLLKHILGLRSEWPNDVVRLYYLWFDTGLDDAVIHRHEISRFLDLVEGNVVFVAMSYQELYARAMGCGKTPSHSWTTYMRQRYCL